jgi:predicted alpha/beta hydrolase family esterase
MSSSSPTALGCLPVVHLAGEALTCRGVVLVAPPDVHGPPFPPPAAGFSDPASAPSKVPALVISSSNDPYCAPAVAEQLADRWHAEHVDAGARGHLNESAELGYWQPGWDLVHAFAGRIGGAVTR